MAVHTEHTFCLHLSLHHGGAHKCKEMVWNPSTHWVNKNIDDDAHCKRCMKLAVFPEPHSWPRGT